HTRAERPRLHYDRARFVPRDQLRFLLRVIVEEETEKKDLRLGTRTCEANPEDGFLGKAGILLAGHDRHRFHPVGRHLRLGTRGSDLAQIEPRTVERAGPALGSFTK